MNASCKNRMRIIDVTHHRNYEKPKRNPMKCPHCGNIIQNGQLVELRFQWQAGSKAEPMQNTKWCAGCASFWVKQYADYLQQEVIPELTNWMYNLAFVSGRK